ncbi:uncharacterized protein LOC143786058 [Ranitomeya variabilis]|uniref:uncharacterized protein LOC143786058 n=1 Tax=Ranitomeya variabilis TaxID=490064 RepID=UPI004057C15F
MLFRILLVLSVLFAPAEGAPIFICNPRSQEQITINEENITVPPKTSEDTVYRIVIPAAVLFVLAVIIGAIAIICCCLKKKKPTKDAKSKHCADDIRASNTELNGKHEDYITITIDDLPHRPGNEQRDVFTGSKISVPGPPDVIPNISPDEDEVTSSDREFDITMPHKAGIVEVKESKINPDLNDYKQTPPSILKGRNQMKNKNTGKKVSFQESDDRYVYTYDSDSSQPGCQMRYF